VCRPRVFVSSTSAWPRGKKEKTATGGYIGGAPPFRYPSDHRVTLLPEPEMQHIGRSMRRVSPRVAAAEGTRLLSLGSWLGRSASW
jgi:hypothetical protein